MGSGGGHPRQGNVTAQVQITFIAAGQPAGGYV